MPIGFVGHRVYVQSLAISFWGIAFTPNHCTWASGASRLRLIIAHGLLGHSVYAQSLATLGSWGIPFTPNQWPLGLWGIAFTLNHWPLAFGASRLRPIIAHGLLGHRVYA